MVDTNTGPETNRMREAILSDEHEHVQHAGLEVVRQDAPNGREELRRKAGK